MEKYFRKITENTHFKGFVAGVVTSTIAFGLLSSTIFYMAIQSEDDYEYEYEDSGRYYENIDSDMSTMKASTMKASYNNLTESQSQTLETQKKTPATQTENVILCVNEFDKPKIDIDKVNTMLSRDHWGAGYFP